jgi:SAM-dependent methyltransferase
MILHLKRVLQGVACGLRHRIKMLFRIPEKPHTPVLDSNPDAFQRHLRIVKLLQSSLPSHTQGIACEVGSGDCLATADFLLGSGFEEVYLVEKKKIVVDFRQRAILKRMAQDPTLPNRMQVLAGDDGGELDASRVTVIPEYFEQARFDKKVSLLFSHDVLEHVEDLGGFFRHCHHALLTGGVMVHKFDLSGHEWFEDPIPPLDFQTYPDWLYALIFPKYRRACRWFLDQIATEITKAGFVITDTVHLHDADRNYVECLKPKLRPEARKRSVDELMPLDIVITARRI